MIASVPKRLLSYYLPATSNLISHMNRYQAMFQVFVFFVSSAEERAKMNSFVSYQIILWPTKGLIIVLIRMGKLERILLDSGQQAVFPHYAQSVDISAKSSIDNAS